MFIPTDTIYDMAVVDRRTRLDEAEAARFATHPRTGGGSRFAALGTLRRRAGSAVVQFGVLLHGGQRIEPVKGAGRAFAAGR